MIVVGIDPGTVTGIAIWEARDRQLQTVTSLPILRAISCVRVEAESAAARSRPFLVIFEDARTLRIARGYNQGKIEVLQGVGSVKRDCAIWEEFLEDFGVPYLAKRWTRGTTKWSAEKFNRTTGWTRQTNEHARDAALVVFGLNMPMCEGIVRAWHEDRERKKKSIGKSSALESTRALPLSPSCPTAGAASRTQS